MFAISIISLGDLMIIKQSLEGPTRNNLLSIMEVDRREFY